MFVRDETVSKRRRLTWVALITVFAVTQVGAPLEKTSELRSELASLQNEVGLGLSYFGWYIGTIQFAHRQSVRSQPGPGPTAFSQNGDISPHRTMIAFAWYYGTDASGKTVTGRNPDGHRLGIINVDGTSLREVPTVKEPKYFCWSPDESKLAIYTFQHDITREEGKLFVLDLRSNAIEQIATGPAFLTPQCWSPDGRGLVYGISELGNESNPVGKVAVYSFAEKAMKIVGPGAYPTWSADSQWISFLDGDDYYITRPSGDDRKLFLHAARPKTGLLWSPDGRFVAYGLCCKYDWSTTLWRFYVRRLRDNTEDWVADIGDIPLGRDVHWVQPAKPTRENLGK